MRSRNDRRCHRACRPAGRALGLFFAGWLGLAGAAPTADDVAGWADGLFEQALAGKRLSGAVVVLVQDGQTAFARGYGHADLRAGTPVDPEATRFRIGSITKTFTATAIARLLQDGRIDSLDDPVNKYLRRHAVESGGDRDVTLRDLVTHSAGFESRVFHIASDAAMTVPLAAEDIEPFTAKPVNEPGRYSSYNNYGTAVLGLVVEDVSALSYDEYLRQHLFEPLGMRNTVVGLLPDPDPRLGVPFGFLPNGEALAIRHRTVHPFFAPAGGINATGEDMAVYMKAQLPAHDGSNALLDAEHVRLMQQQLRANHALSTGFGMLFFTWNWNGEPIVLHGGDWPGTHSGMLLFPNSRTGLFFSLLADYPEVPILETITGSARMTAGTGQVVEPPLSNVGVIYSYLERFHGRFAQPAVSGEASSERDDYLGNYVAQAAPRSTMERLTSMVSPFAVVTVTPAADDEGILLNGIGPYTSIGPGVFWRADMQVPLHATFLDSPLVNFVREEHGEVDYLTTQIGFDVWRKAGPFANPGTYAALLGASILVLLTGIATLFFPKVPGRRVAKWLPPAMLVLIVAMPVLLLAGRSDGNTVVNDLFFGHRGRFAGLAVLANLAVACGLYLAWHAGLAWRERYWSGNRFGTAFRLHYSLLGLGALLAIPALIYFNLAGI